MSVFLRRLCDSGSREKHCFSRFDACGNLLLTNDVYAPFSERKHKVVGYCKGLFCLEYDNGEILVWNPSTNEFKLIPPSDSKTPLLCPYPNCDCNCTVNVISVVRGLGFDPKSHDYKVVKFVANFYDHYKDYDHGFTKRVEVYSLKNDCWKGIGSGESTAYDIVDECATYVNGFCYWIGHRKAIYPLELDIVSFDLAKETFSTIRLPERFFLSESSFLLTQLKESLAVVVYRRMGIDKVLHPWVRVVTKDHRRRRRRQRWTRKMASKVNVRAERLLGYSRNGKLLFLEGFDQKLLVYDSVAKELKKIDQIYDYPHSMQLFQYAESTVSLLATLDTKEKEKEKRKRGSR